MTNTLSRCGVNTSTNALCAGWGSTLNDPFLFERLQENNDFPYVAGKIYNNLRSKGMLIDIEDILIGATAISNNLKLAADNIEHFSRIEGLDII